MQAHLFSDGSTDSLHNMPLNADRSRYPVLGHFIGHVERARSSLGNRVVAFSDFNRSYFFKSLLRGYVVGNGTANKITFPTETYAAITPTYSQTGPASYGRDLGSYFSGGGGSSLLAYKIQNYTDTLVAVPSANLALAANEPCGTANNDFGVVIQGTNANTVYLVPFASETIYQVPSMFTTYTNQRAEANSIGDVGYVAGGAFPNYGTINKIQIIGQVTTVSPSVLSVQRGNIFTSAAFSFSRGYWNGGYNTAGTSQTVCDRIDYCTDTVSTIASAAMPAAIGIGGSTYTPLKAFYGGGYNGSAKNSGYVLSFATETISTGTNFPTATYDIDGTN